MTESAWTAPCGIEDIIATNPQIHGHGVCGLEKCVVEELKRRLSPGMRTMETGSGLSTFVFALAGAYHTAITPSQSEIDAITKIAASCGASFERVVMIPQPSHIALPQQPVASFDLILIDGCHGIPMVQVDYLYCALALKVGGTLVLDDVHLSPVRDLLRFLNNEASWKLQGIYGKTAFLTKLKSGEEIREWDDQPFVAKQTARIFHNWRLRRYMLRARRAGGLLANGDFKQFAKKLFR